MITPSYIRSPSWKMGLFGAPCGPSVSRGTERTDWERTGCLWFMSSLSCAKLLVPAKATKYSRPSLSCQGRICGSAVFAMRFISVTEAILNMSPVPSRRSERVSMSGAGGGHIVAEQIAVDHPVVVLGVPGSTLRARGRLIEDAIDALAGRRAEIGRMSSRSAAPSSLR